MSIAMAFPMLDKINVCFDFKCKTKIFFMVGCANTCLNWETDCIMQLKDSHLLQI